MYIITKAPMKIGSSAPEHQRVFWRPPVAMPRRDTALWSGMWSAQLEGCTRFATLPEANAAFCRLALEHWTSEEGGASAVVALSDVPALLAADAAARAGTTEREEVKVERELLERAKKAEAQVAILTTTLDTAVRERDEARHVLTSPIMSAARAAERETASGATGRHSSLVTVDGVNMVVIVQTQEIEMTLHRASVATEAERDAERKRADEAEARLATMIDPAVAQAMQDGPASLLLEVQAECVGLRKERDEATAALAVMRAALEAGAGLWRCSCCGEAKGDPPDPMWRWNGDIWQHSCQGPQIGAHDARWFGGRDGVRAALATDAGARALEVVREMERLLSHPFGPPHVQVTAAIAAYRALFGGGT